MLSNLQCHELDFMVELVLHVNKEKVFMEMVEMRPAAGVCITEPQNSRGWK